MLSAATSHSRQTQLEAFQLALSLLARGFDAPKELKDYLQSVLRQANTLVHNPRSNVEQLPESIELAYEMQRIKNVRTIVETILTSPNLLQADAQKLLKELEHNNAGQERPRTDRIVS